MINQARRRAINWEAKKHDGTSKKGIQAGRSGRKVQRCRGCVQSLKEAGQEREAGRSMREEE